MIRSKAIHGDSGLGCGNVASWLTINLIQTIEVEIVTSRHPFRYEILCQFLC